MRWFRRVWNAVSTVLVLGVVLLAFLLVGVRLVGLTPYAVLSGSMEPTYHVGSLIYVGKIAPEEITVGTPITFVVNEDLLLATHRVVDIEVQTTKSVPMVDEAGQPVLDAQGNPVSQEVPLDEPAYYFTTKGDANDAIDGTPVYYKNVVGKPVFSLPYLGYLSSWLQTRQGMIMGISIALVLLLLTFLPDLLSLADDEPQKERKKRPEPPQSAPQPLPQAGARRRRAACEAQEDAPQAPPPNPQPPTPAPEAQEPSQSMRRRRRPSYNNINQEQGGQER